MNTDLQGRWDDYTATYDRLAERFPFLLAARHDLFQTAIAGRPHQPSLEYPKLVARRVLERERTALPDRQADVVVWLDSDRSILVDALAPVVSACRRRGLKTEIVATPDAVASVAALDPITLRAPYKVRRSLPWDESFDALRRELPWILEEKDRSYFRVLARQAETLEAEVHRILETLTPGAVLTGRDQTLVPGIVATTARAMGIPALSLQHGNISVTDRPVIADVLGVWGDMSRNRLRGYRVPDTRIRVVGSPRHDLASAGVADNDELRSEARGRLDAGGRVVLAYFSNGHAAERLGQHAIEEAAAWMEAAAARLSQDLLVVVKLHPNEDGALYEQCRHVVVLQGDIDLPALFAASDLTASIVSTTISESVLFDRPALQLLGDDWPELVDNWRHGIAVRVRSLEDLQAIVMQAADVDGYARLRQQQRLHRDAVFANLGHAAEAVADWMASAVSDGRRGAWPNCRHDG